MQNYRKIFSEGLNADDDFSVISKGQWVNASNIRTFTTDSGATGRIEAIGGNSLLFNTLPSGTNKAIGVVSDEAKKRIIFLNWNNAGNHAIYCYDKISGVTYTVLLSSQVTGGLGFDKYHRPFYNVKVIGDLLYWTDNFIRQRRANIESGIKMNHPGYVTDQDAYVDPLTQEVISLLKKPPLYPVTFNKATQPDLSNNYISGNSFQFMANYYYKDGETSVLSVYSKLCPFNLLADTSNRVDVFFPIIEQIDQDVQAVNLVVRYGETNNFFVIKTWDKSIAADSSAIENHNSGAVQLYFAFYNNTIGQALDKSYAVTPFNSVPVLSKTQEFAKDRLFLGNNLNGYDTPKVNSLTANFITQTQGAGASAVIGFVLRALYTGAQGPFYFVTISGTTIYDGYYAQPVSSNSNPGTLTWSSLIFIGNTEISVDTYFGINAVPDGSYRFVSNNGTIVSLTDSPFSTNLTGYGVFKTDNSYELGIVFYDFGDRKCGVSPYSGTVVSTPIIVSTSVPLNSADAASNTYTFPVATGTQPLARDILTSYGLSGALPAGDWTVISSIVVGSNYVLKLLETIFSSSISSSTISVQRNSILTGTVMTPDRKYATTTFTTSLNWGLSNENAVNEIPDWAVKYSIVLTKSLRTRFFIQARAKDVKYATKDLTSGVYTFTSGTYAANLSGIGIDFSLIEGYGMGYLFTQGDLVKVYIGENIYTLSITGQSGSWIICQLKDIGSLAAAPFNTALFEIFTPYKLSLSEPFYEVGNAHPIINPGTTSKTYSVTGGSISGDIFMISRNDGTASYLTENMSGNDTFWRNWFTDAGRVNAIETIGQKRLSGNIAFSNTYLQGTKVNGLSSFEVLNVEELGAENGAIQKLQLANKVQTDGTVMLAICQNEAVSMYLGEQELFDTQGSAFIAKASGVIGTVKSLKGSMGTSNPESVFEYNGQVFWWDIRNASAVQYSNNGLYPISKKKFVRPSKLFSKKFSGLTTGQIEALGSDPYIIGGYDPYHNEVLFSIPSTEAAPKGNLVDYPSVIYPYDIYDGQGKTLIYKHEADAWFGSMPFQAELFIKMDNDLYSFKNGSLYIHNQSNLCNFYGVQYTAKLMFASNPGAIHTFLSLGLESNKVPSWVHFRTEDPYVQSSDLPYEGISEFKSKQGVIEASLMRDRSSPNTSGDYDQRQLSGDRLIGKALLTMLEYEFVTDPTPLELRVFNLGHNINTGTLINKQ